LLANSQAEDFIDLFSFGRCVTGCSRGLSAAGAAGTGAPPRSASGGTPARARFHKGDSLNFRFPGADGLLRLDQARQRGAKYREAMQRLGVMAN